jgi:trimethylamine--corrinoid protein Co-methyltransferase
MDMRFGTMASGSIDVGIMAVGAAQIARRYGMPSGVFYPMTDSKVPDAQASYEKHLQTMLCAMAGIHYIMPLGGLENESAFSPAQLVLDNEVCQMVGKVLEGIRVDDQRMAVDLIKEVGPVPGNYLRKEHTRQHWQEGYLVPELSVREGYEAWVAGGSKTAIDLAAEKAIQLMESHQPRPLPAEDDAAIAEILKEAERVKMAG